MKIIRKIIFVLALIFSEIAHAGVWSLDSCLSYAVSHNIDVLAQQLRVTEGEQALTEAKDRFLPQLSASASQSFSFGRGLTAENTYANRNTSQTGWNIGLNLPLFQGLAEYRGLDVAKANISQYLYETEAARQNVALNVISQYLQVLYAKEVALSSRSQEELSKFQVERQKAMIEAGKVAEATLYDLEAVAAQDRLRVVTSDNDVRTALVTLASLLQLPTSEGFDILPLDGGEPTIPSPDSVYAGALETNAAILGARQAVKVADANIAYAKSGYIPTFSFNAGIGSNYYKTGGFDNENFGAQMRHNLSKYLGFSLTVPIFDGFGTRNSVRRAKTQRTSAQLEVERREYDMRKDIDLAYVLATGARDKYLSAGETLEATRLSFDSTSERFNLGRATQADYEQAKDNLYRTEISLIQARYEYLMRCRILMFYMDPGATAED